MITDHTAGSPSPVTAARAACRGRSLRPSTQASLSWLSCHTLAVCGKVPGSSRHTTHTHLPPRTPSPGRHPAPPPLSGPGKRAPATRLSRLPQGPSDGAERGRGPGHTLSSNYRAKSRQFAFTATVCKCGQLVLALGTLKGFLRETLDPAGLWRGIKPFHLSLSGPCDKDIKASTCTHLPGPKQLRSRVGGLLSPFKGFVKC